MANSAFQQPATPSPLPVANGGTGASTALVLKKLAQVEITQVAT